MNEAETNPPVAMVSDPRWPGIRNLKYPVRAKLLKPMVIGSLGLSLWQGLHSLIQYLSKPPEIIIGPAQVLGGMAGLIVLLIAPGILVEIISQASKGKSPDISSAGLAGRPGTIVKATLKSSVIFIWSFLPLEIYLALLVKNKAVPSYGLALVLLSLGLIYFPMALLLMAVSGKAMPSLLASQVLEPMAKTAAGYAKFLVLFWPLLLLPMAGLQLWPIPFIGPWVSSFLFLYLWACAMNLLGEFYFRTREKIGKQ